MMVFKKQLTFIALFLLGIGVVLFGKVFIASQSNKFTPQDISFQVNPPTQALSGSVSILFGDVKKLSRTGLDFEPTKAGDEILQGESISTAEGTSTVTFNQFAQIDISKNSKITFVTTIPAQFSIRQTQGKVSYQSKTVQAFSIRSQHLLLTFNGRVNVEVDDEKGSIAINMMDGTGTIGVTDVDGQANKWDIKKGQKVLYDDDKQVVKIS